MINYLLEQSLILSCLILFLIIFRNKLNESLGAFHTYMLWAFIPFSVLLSLCSAWLTPSLPYQIFQYSAELRTPLNVLPKLNDIESSIWITLWFVGMAILLVQFTYLHFVQRRSLRTEHQMADFNNLNVTLPNGLTLSTSSSSQSPFIFGLINPKLVLPVSFTQLYNQEQQQLVLQHELCHFNTKDHLWNGLAMILLLVFWFNPLIWLGYRYFRYQQELACDHQVLANASVTKRKHYALAMLSTTKATSTSFLTQINYSENSHMKERVRFIGRHNQNKKLPSLLAICLGLSLIGTSQLVLAGANKNSMAKPSYREAPKYPIEAVEQHTEGYVTLSFSVETDGTVSDIKVLESHPKGMFDKSATKALMLWQYEPSNQRQTDVRVQLDFVLDESNNKAPKYQGTEIIKAQTK